MSDDPKTYIDINGETREVSSLTLPPEGKALRGAWQFSGDVVTIDMDKARQFKAERLLGDMYSRERELRQEAVEAELRGDVAMATAKMQAAEKMRGRPNLAKIKAAQTPEELAALTPEDVI